MASSAAPRAGQPGAARVSELMLQDGQNYVYLRHVYMERPLDKRLKLSACRPTDPTRVIIEIFGRFRLDRAQLQRRGGL